MKQLGRMILPALALLILLLVRAMAYDAVEVEIPVKTNESCVIELAGDFTDQKTIDGSGAFTVSVSHPGTYNCQVRQIPGTEENKIYDRRVYNVLLFVETDGDALRSAIVLSLDGEAEKPAELIFENETAEHSRRTGHAGHAGYAFRSRKTSVPQSQPRQQHPCHRRRQPACLLGRDLCPRRRSADRGCDCMAQT